MASATPVFFIRRYRDSVRMVNNVSETSASVAMVYTTPVPWSGITASLPSAFSMMAVIAHGTPRQRTMPNELAPIELAMPVPV